MKKFFWLMTGVAAGLVIAKQIESNPRAQAVVDDATAKAKEFGAAIAEGFKEREAELAEPVATTKVSATTKGTTQTAKRAPSKPHPQPPKPPKHSLQKSRLLLRQPPPKRPPSLSNAHR